MDKKNISLDFEIRFQKVQDLNPSFDLARVAVAYHGLNRNHSIISKEVFEKSKESMYNIPVVGRYIPESDDFGSHDVQVVEIDGKQSVEAATVPFGVVPESAVIEWEVIEEDDGTKREYLITDCLIWKRSYGYQKLISQDKWSQSMEITVNDCTFDESGIMTITDMTFNALCILGNSVEPCFESANIQFSMTPEDEEFKNNFSLMLSELKELTVQNFSSDENTKEGGCDELNEEVKEFEEIESEEIVEAEIVEESPEEYTKDETKDMDPDEKEDDEEDDDYACGDKDDEKEKKCALNSEFSKTYNEVREVLCNAVCSLYSSVEENGVVVGETYYYLSDFDDKYVYVNSCTYTESGHEESAARIPYSITDSNCDLGSPETMIVKWLTLEENEIIEAERQELSVLRQFKAEKIAEEHKNEVNEFINKEFADVVETEEFTNLGESVYDLDRDTLTEKLYAIRGRHAVYCMKEPEAAEVEEFKIPVDTKKKEINNKYGNLFETYAIKK